MRSWCGPRSPRPSRRRKSRLGPPGPELLALEGELADHVFEHGHADAWLGRNAHRAVWIHDERLTDDLCGEVALRGGDIARQTEVRERREMHVVRPADAHLEHPSAPHGHVVRAADVVNTLRRSEPADPPGLDVHDPRWADRDRLARVLAGVDRLVETDGRLDLALERRVVDEIVVRERLLDHHRARRIDALEKRSVAERVGRVRVEHEGKIGEGPPRRLRDLNLEAGLDLELHTLVPALDLAADSVHERFDRWLYANGDTAQDPIAGPAEQHGERLSRALREEVPDRHLDGRLRHAVFPDPRELLVDVLRRGKIRLEQLRQDELLERVQDGARRLARVPRDLAGDALAPPDRALRLHAAEHSRHVGLPRAARLIGALQGKAHEEKLDPLQFHGGFAAMKSIPVPRRVTSCPGAPAPAPLPPRASVAVPEGTHIARPLSAGPRRRRRPRRPRARSHRAPR